ncbi:MAG: hypothetical protein BGO55_00790 [Sphingobacteriales bacterium 50-39]|nr:hypothetical protein [Sphingobacteriales bacterium]OJW53651.1 MAG: hypothetical protein BGO55_00790 [Sphingobacteriales bacterium 50-39]
MKVKQKILDVIDNPIIRTSIAGELRVGEQTVAIHMRRNASNGRMTKMDFLQAISRVASVGVDEILEEEGETTIEGI